MSTRSVGALCLVLALVLSLLAVVALLGGGASAGPSGAMARAAILAAPLLAVITGLYLRQKTPTYG
jgi:hypothetical protein